MLTSFIVKEGPPLLTFSSVEAVTWLAVELSTSAEVEPTVT